MPRRNRDDDRPARKGSLLWLWLLAAVCGAFVVLAGGIAVVGLALWNAKPGATAGQQKRTYTRDEFRAAVLGKTKDEVIVIAGRPESTREPRDGHYWNYSGLAYDPVSGKPSSIIRVHFGDDDKVKEVTY